ncbi:alpha/beta hydrolase [Rhodoferax sp. TBRC 17198]|jgi:pimeloyl-ACP methyl ester carboxylesterase|uniref:Alpha/beta hydrolase n=1 Tax=Rhodoferax potami TaxID=3068338 RepID=A0ABU3KL75_9BURK|nr:MULTISPECIES: alpha/beta hydrolase [unclassified Rhodoferax]MDT7518024.1 alpha/beta hydrolase [Rhodoferax sp. TBRC 17660]MDT7521194.1 alpha/beta hydrolase [Rhodoferax sp. TBRC 17198]
MYQVRRPHQSQFVSIRNLDYHVQVWGEPGPGKVPLVMVHGWMDVAASYQFVVDAFSEDHYIIAPDWRGYGRTRAPLADNYWFPDYLADLDFLLDHYAPGQQVNLVGHSMGGNVVMLYGGVRPERIRRLVNLEGFGMPATIPAQAPGRFATWMDELKKLHAGEMDLKAYDSADGVARRLMKTNPRLSQEKADWLARHWAAENADGSWSILGEPAHKVTNAQLYRVEEVMAIYQRLTMPVLAVEASDNSLDMWWKGQYTLAEYHERLKVVPQVEVARIEDAGHMMHHDQPGVLAERIERFIR